MAEKKERKPINWRRVGVGTLVGVVLAWFVLHDSPTLHKSVIATTYAVGEDAPGGARTSSAWDTKWQQHFGGIDTPGKRQNHDNWPASFTPKENPFYAALPYSEFSASGKVKKSAERIPWYDSDRPPAPGRSILKNGWIKVTFGSKEVYVQWEDAGPGGTDDVEYVFGDKPPKHKAAGIGLSPAALFYLQAQNGDAVDWQFVEESQVAVGPWKNIVTTRRMTQ